MGQRTLYTSQPMTVANTLSQAQPSLTTGPIFLTPPTRVTSPTPLPVSHGASSSNFAACQAGSTTPVQSTWLSRKTEAPGS
ncbi:hypothetical protein N658DRAFT_496437 [Parathielavia hyrcaniae]|uniref:Uncharacterized protein n=1 Tax=Parathielavia hyrcaniae TaxID=113614 RepID=A0AAN6Q050_9PEZI|nr:hypothetical protein N658DRAFT_496437 [Parathielavia hyrcaniae]